jgi:hypothetical protein
MSNIKNNLIQETVVKEEGNKSNPTLRVNLPLIKLLKKVCIPSSPQSIRPQGGSINQTYLYNYNKSNQQRYTKLLTYIQHKLNHFFGTFYSISSKPVFLFTQNKLIISVNYFMPTASKKLITRHL